MEKTTKTIDEYTASWYVVCTATKAEKTVIKQLEQSGFEIYLPLQPVVRVWNSQKKEVMTPIIPRIIFVCLSTNDIEQMISLCKGTFLLQEKEQYISISIEQMKTLRDAIEQTNELVEFLPEKFNMEVIAGEQSPKLAEKLVSQRHFTKFTLPIKGLGVILVKVEDRVHQKS